MMELTQKVSGFKILGNIICKFNYKKNRHLDIVILHFAILSA